MIKIYTDGATSNNGYANAVGGCAYLVLNGDDLIYKTSWAFAPATNNQCEMKAIIEGCKYVKEIFPSEKVIIYSDSAYCINCYNQKWYIKWLNNNWINSKKESVKNKELWEQLIPFFEDENFDFVKVSGHSGVEYNEEVDRMAVEARLHQEVNK